MKKILLAGLLAVSSTGAFFTAPIFAADDDNHSDQRDHHRDDNDDNRPSRPDHTDNHDRDHHDGDRDQDRDHHDGDHDHTATNRDHHDGDHHDGDNTARDHRWNNNHPDWNGSRPGTGVPPRNSGYVPPRPLPNNGYGYGRPGHNDDHPGNSYGHSGSGNYYGRYGGGYGGNYNGYGSQNLENIAKRIESALRNDRQLNHYKLGTDTVRGTIELEGKVRSNSERQRAISIARDIARSVQINGSRLQVRY